MDSLKIFVEKLESGVRALKHEFTYKRTKKTSLYYHNFTIILSIGMFKWKVFSELLPLVV